jgi:hypothetical protein
LFVFLPPAVRLGGFCYISLLRREALIVVRYIFFPITLGKTSTALPE